MIRALGRGSCVHCDDDSLTRQIDGAIDAAGTDDSGQGAAAAGRAFLAAADDEW